MIRLIALFWLLFFGKCTFSQNLNLEWVTQLTPIGGSGINSIEDIAIDKEGNTISVGTFSGLVDFDPDTSASDTFFVSSMPNVEAGFIHKLDSVGNFIWVKTIDFGIGPGPEALALDQAEDIYITGEFRGTVDFDPGPLTNNLTSTQGDAFILKLSSNGDFRWVRNYSSSSGDGVAIGPKGNVYYSGSNNTNLFVIKLDSSNGSIIWRKDFTSSANGMSFCPAITVDSSLNVYTSGYAHADLDFDPSNSSVSRIGTNRQAFVHKLDSNGNFVWVSKGLGTRSAGEDIVVSKDARHIYTVGFHDTITSFYRQAYVDKWDQSGNLIWSYRTSTPGNAGFNSIIMDDSARIYCLGNYYSDTTSLNFFGSFGSWDSLPSNSGGVFILKMDTSGRIEWLESIRESTQSNVSGRGIGLHSNLDLQLCGEFTGSVDMDPGIDSTILMAGNPFSSSSEDFFISRISQCFNSYTVDNQVVCDSLQWLDGITYFTSTSIPTFTLTNAAGCDSIIRLDLRVNSIDTGITQLNDSLFSNQLNATSYQWLDCNNSNSIINGANSRKYVPTQNGVYAVEVTRQNCLDTSACFSFISTSIDELRSKEELLIYPKPSNGRVNITSTIEIKELILYDHLGRALVRFANLNTQFQFFLPEKSGLYLIRWQGEDGSSGVEKIIRN